MKYSLSSRQTAEYLNKCDEIKVKYRDRDIIFDLIEKYPGKTINLVKDFSDTEIIDWKEIGKFITLTQGNFILGVSFNDELLSCKKLAQEKNLKFYYTKPIKSYQELFDLVGYIRVSQVIVDAPLFFDLENVRRQFGHYDVSIRVCANSSRKNAELCTNGLYGAWIRPEDITMYDDLIDIVDFDFKELSEERALFRIYAEGQGWPSELGVIVSNLNYPFWNDGVSSAFTRNRISCRQKCMEGSSCQTCNRFAMLSKPIAEQYRTRNPVVEQDS